MENNRMMGKTKKFFKAYETFCKPYCDEMGLTILEIDILLMIYNKKEIITANEICQSQNIKPNLMSFHVEKLVQAGFIERRTIDGNRRSISLVCTDKAKPIIEKSMELNKKYTKILWDGISEEEIKAYNLVVEKMNSNIEKIINGEIK